MTNVYYYPPSEHAALDELNITAWEFMQLGDFRRGSLNRLLASIEPNHVNVFAWFDGCDWHACYTHFVNGVIVRSYISPEGYPTQGKAFAAALAVCEDDYEW